MSGIYLIICHTNGVVYVGESSDMCVRLKDHKNRLRRGASDNPRLQRAWDKYGEGAFEFSLFYKMPNSTVDERLAVEGRLMKLLKPVFNMQPPGVPPSQKGNRWTSEQRARHSKRLKGKPKSPEHRAKIAANNRVMGVAKRGVPLSREHRERIKEGSAKRNLTPELRARFAAASNKRWALARSGGC